MSIKMYCYIIKKDVFWDVIKTIRETYREKHPVILMMNTLFEKQESSASHKEIWDFIDALNENMTVELQIFDRENDYVIRPLEAGYFFMNMFSDNDKIEYAIYDDRADVPEESLKYRPLVDWIDEQIQKQEYFMYPIIDKNTLSRYATDWQVGEWEKIRKEKLENSNQKELDK